MTIYDHLRNAEAELLAAVQEDTPAEYRMDLYEILLAVAELRGNLPHTVQWPEGSPKGNPLYDDPGILPCGKLDVDGSIDASALRTDPDSPERQEKFAAYAKDEAKHAVTNVYISSNISPEEIVKNLYVPYSNV